MILSKSMKRIRDENESFKRSHQSFLIALLVSLEGCMTQSTLKHATGFTRQSGNGEPDVDVKGEPDYYFLLPVTILADAATSPVIASVMCRLATALTRTSVSGR